MGRLIEADEVIKRLCAECVNFGSFLCISCIAPKVVKDMPTVIAEPVRHGRWIKLPKSCQADYECSECGAGIGKVKPPYCAICGAKNESG